MPTLTIQYKPDLTDDQIRKLARSDYASIITFTDVFGEIDYLQQVIAKQEELINAYDKALKQVEANSKAQHDLHLQLIEAFKKLEDSASKTIPISKELAKRLLDGDPIALHVLSSVVAE